MNDENFEKQEKFFRKHLDSVRANEVPKEILKGFRESVEKRILETEGYPAALGFPLPAAAVCLGVLVLLAAAFLMLRSHPETARPGKAMTEEVQPIENPASSLPAVREDTGSQEGAEPAAPPDAELLTDVEVLQALGAWTEDDEKSVGINVENRLQDLELFFDADAAPIPGV